MTVVGGLPRRSLISSVMVDGGKGIGKAGAFHTHTHEMDPLLVAWSGDGHSTFIH